MSETLLDVRDLTIAVRRRRGEEAIVHDVAFRVESGEAVAVVGESGSGKTLTMLSVMGLLPGPALRVSRGQILFSGRDLTQLRERELRRIRGAELAMIYQDPMTSLNPLMRIGDQIAEALTAHGVSGSEADRRTRGLLADVGIPDPARTVRAYPHEFSGGMRQRVMIATALALSPRLLIADEPTTALDVTIQQQILALARSLQDDTGWRWSGSRTTSALSRAWSSGCRHVRGHDRRTGADAALFRAPRAPVHRRPARLAARPDATSAAAARADPRSAPRGRLVAARVPLPAPLPAGGRALRGRAACPHAARRGRGCGLLRPARGVEAVILRAVDLIKDYPIRGTGRHVRAVAGVSLELALGETLGIVGESGCGKSTLARLLVRLERPTAGRIEFEGTDIAALSRRELRAIRRRIQMVFQDPYASLDPRQTVGGAIAEVLRVHRLADGNRAERRRTIELLGMVGLSESHLQRYPHELSGGQRQRVSIARSLAAEPSVLVLDEPVSALDVSVRAEVMNLLVSLRDRLGLSYVFISHDLSMVRHLSNRIAVMYLGRVVELGPWDGVLDEPLHPYTRALADAMPVPDPELAAGSIDAPVRGEVPDPAAPPPGCPFHPRCPLAERICREELPALLRLLPEHQAACHVAQRRVAGARAVLAGGES